MDYVAHNKQNILHQSAANEILFGGAAGPGKSKALRMECLRWALRVPNIQIYLFRRTFPELERNHIIPSLMEFPRNLCKWNDQKKRWACPHGAILHMCHCQYEKDVFDYQGAEINLLAIDELTSFTEFIYDYLRGRVRCTLDIPPNWRHKIPGIICASNPGGIGHRFVKKRWVDYAEPLEIVEAPAKEGGMFRQYIPAVLEDNPSLMEMDPGYVARLDGLPEPYRTAYKEGRWDIFIGQMFGFDEKYHVINPMPVPDNVPLYMTFDWGFGKPYSTGWWWVDGEGRLYQFTELYGMMPGQIDVGLRQTDEEIAEEIIKHEKSQGIWGRRIVRLCDPTCFNKKPDYRGGGQGPSTAEVFARAGLVLTPGDPSRILKIRQFHQRLRIFKDGRMPMMVVYRGCEAFIRTIPLLQPDSNNVEDVQTNSEDHCLAGDMLVDSPSGQQKIRDIVGKCGFVYTADGIRLFEKCRLTRKNALIISVALRCGCVIQCTPDHKLLTTEGWIEAGQSKGRTLCVSQSLARDFSCLTGSDFIGMVMHDVSVIEQGNFSTGLFTKRLRVKFLMECLFIIVMGIGEIIKLKISNVFHRWNTEQGIHGWVRHWIGNVISFQKHGNSQTSLTFDASANSAARNFLHEDGVNQKDVSVVEPVVKLGGIVLKKDGSQRSAQSVRNTLRPKMQTLLPVHTSADGLIVERVTDAGAADVYCLTVPDVHLFSIQGGIIVRNCYDSSALVCMARPVGGVQASKRIVAGGVDRGVA